MDKECLMRFMKKTDMLRHYKAKHDQAIYKQGTRPKLTHLAWRERERGGASC
jgi:hypothetical protein